VLEHYFGGVPDEATDRLLARLHPDPSG
jgi:hypothetical protein